MQKAAYFMITSFGILAMLIIGKQILIPLIFAFLIWLLMREIKLIIDRNNFIKTKIPNWLKYLFITLLFFTTTFFLANIVIHNILNLSKALQIYYPQLKEYLAKMSQYFNVDLSQIFLNHLNKINFGEWISRVISSLSNILGTAIIVLFYVIFIFLESSHFSSKITKAFSKNNASGKIFSVLKEIEGSIMHYIGLKTLTSFITGILSYFALSIIGVEYAPFWAFLIFILNFIPNIGSIVATLFPTIYSLLQYGDMFHILSVLIILSAIQIVIGNFIEPKWMGDSLNISALVTIIALIFWGAIWGVVGMILSVPITVIIVNICSKFPETKALAVMLSDKGKI